MMAKNYNVHLAILKLINVIFFMSFQLSKRKSPKKPSVKESVAGDHSECEIVHSEVPQTTEGDDDCIIIPESDVLPDIKPKIKKERISGSGSQSGQKVKRSKNDAARENIHKEFEKVSLQYFRKEILSGYTI